MATPLKGSPRAWTMIFVTLSAVTALGLRILLPYQAVFSGDAVFFIETDAWYHMRLVDALVRHFPHRLWFDPYLHHPGGEAVTVGPFFDWLIAGIAILLGGGSPSARLVDHVGAFLPAFVGALTVIPVYVIGRELFNRPAGLWAAAIVGVLPGEFLTRSLAGYTDHHCAEVLLSSLAVMYLVLALKTSATIQRRVAYSALGGIALGCYLLTWSGGALFVAIVVVWAAAQMVLDRLCSRAAHHVLVASVPALVVAGLMVLPWASVTPNFRYQLAGVGAGLAALLVLQGLAAMTRGLARGRAIYVATLAVTVAVSAILIEQIAPVSVASALGQLRRFSLERTSILAAEALPLMQSRDRLPFPLWNQLTTSMLFATMALAALVVNTVRRPSGQAVLTLVWTGSILLATIGQVRFAYYFAVNVAVLAGAGCAATIATISTLRTGRGERAASAAPEDVLPKSNRLSVIAIPVLAAVVLLPNISRYRVLAHDIPTSNSAWNDAMNWLRFNTPEPFANPGQYEESSSEPGDERISAYGVLSSWDKGYSIIRVGHRVPIADPRQTGARESSTFFLAEDEVEADRLARGLGARYVIVDWDLQPRIFRGNLVVTGVIRNLAEASGQDLDRYIRVAFRNTPMGRTPVVLYEPAFYRTMMSRLYRAGTGPAHLPTETWVVTLAERQERGHPYSELVKESRFSDYDAAQAFVDAAHSPNVRVVGQNPFISCVPLEPLTDFNRVYRSLESDGIAGPPVVQIYERTAGSAEATTR